MTKIKIKIKINGDTSFGSSLNLVKRLARYYNNLVKGNKLNTKAL